MFRKPHRKLLCKHTPCSLLVCLSVVLLLGTTLALAFMPIPSKENSHEHKFITATSLNGFDIFAEELDEEENDEKVETSAGLLFQGISQLLVFVLPSHLNKGLNTHPPRIAFTVATKTPRYILYRAIKTNFC